VGANNKLKELRNFLKKQETQNKIYTELTNILVGINWHFIPAKSPHMGSQRKIDQIPFKKGTRQFTVNTK
jgi:hypothetical protein